MRLPCTRQAATAVVLATLGLGCNAGPREGTYDQVFTPGSAVGRSGYKSTLVIEPDNRFRYQMPVMSVSGQYRRTGDSLYFETGSNDVRMIALRGRIIRDTLVLEQPQMGMLGGLVGPDIAVQRFVRRR